MQDRIEFFLLVRKYQKIKKVLVKARNVLLLCLVILISIIIVTTLFAGPEPKLAVDSRQNKEKQPVAVIVKFKADNEIYQLKFAPETNIKVITSAYSQRPEVEYAEPDYQYEASILPSDTFLSNQWYLKKIKAPEAWNIEHDSPNIVIAIIDSGVDINNPDLKDNIWTNKNEIAGNNIDDDHNGFVDDVHGWDFVNNVPSPSPKFKPGYTLNGIYHGTIVAGIAAAEGNNAAGIAGITWRAQIMPLKALDDKGEGDTRNIVRAIDYAIANKADIINLSFVGTDYSNALAMAIKKAYDAGIIVVAAAGNEAGEGNGYNLDNTPMYPVCNDGVNGENMVIGVAATDALDQKASFSGYGSKCIDITAPGVSIFSTVDYAPQNIYDGSLLDKYYDGYWSGTSLAVPMVSGALALIESVNPDLTRNEVVDALTKGADNIYRLNEQYFGELGSGRLNVFRSLSYVQNMLKSKRVNLMISSAGNNNGKVLIDDNDGKIISSFSAYDKITQGGVNIAAGDVDGDGKDEIITAPGAGGDSQIKIFDSQGKLKKQFSAYAANFTGGVNIAAGDVDGDGKDEIITAPGAGGDSQIKIFDSQGKLKKQFSAYAVNFIGGVNIAAGDVDGDGKDEIITAPGAGGGPQVRIFNNNGLLQKQFFAYDKKFRGGVRVTTADLAGGTRERKLEIVTAPGAGGGPQVRIFNNNGLLLNQFFAYDKNFKGGVNIGSGDLDNDGLDEIVTGAGPGGAPHVRVFRKDGVLLYSFYAYSNTVNTGINVGTIKY